MRSEDPQYENEISNALKTLCAIEMERAKSAGQGTK